MVQKIIIVISSYSLGECNDDNDNQRYIELVKNKIQSKYPDSIVSIELSKNVASNLYHVSNDCNDEILENVVEIINEVWNNANY